MNGLPSLLVVDDDRVAADLLAEVLGRDGYNVTVANHGRDAVGLGEGGGQFDIVITDLKMPDFSGIDVLNAFKRISPQTNTIVITAFGSFESAIEAIREGAYDYIVKPFKMDEIKSKVAKCLEQRRVISKGSVFSVKREGEFSYQSIIGTGQKMLEIYKTVARVAGSDVPVLIQGESGTGKELIARAIHDNSLRANGPYVVINCATFPEHLLESELFGHVKGSFTNALTDKKGLIEESHMGTCFLDEIGDMPMSLQVKLLRVLQRNEFRRVGSNENMSADVRFIAATNKDLADMVKAKQFREDLFYRLHVVTINIPPLREHPEDIPLLAEYFFHKAVKKTKKDVDGISKEAMDALSRYDWPGNIRELENVLERAIALTSNKVLLRGDIPVGHGRQAAEDDPDGFAPKNLVTLQELKLSYIEQILKHTDGNQNMAADILGIDRKTLYRTLKKMKNTGDDEKDLNSGGDD
jgi:DNA-binding NtrC family response regulator